jgi:hypothetical protein
MNTRASNTLNLEINGDFQLGSFPTGYHDLERAVIHKENHEIFETHLAIYISSKWLDLTALSCLALLLKRASLAFSTVHLQCDPDFIARKSRLLWQLGFWPLVRANAEQSNLTCSPDPWTHQPPPTHANVNFTQCLYQNISPDLDTKPIVAEWEKQLARTEVASLIEHSPVIQSREYLYLLLWELAENAREHSQGRGLLLTGQFFVSKSDFQHPTQPSDLNAALTDSLAAQHAIEINNSYLGVRREWLHSHKNESFLIIGCVDNGIGIPASLRNQHNRQNATDESLLLLAFDPETTTRMENADPVDVHGLSQVLRLVRELNGYLYLQSGNALLEFSNTKTSVSSTLRQRK